MRKKKNRLLKWILFLSISLTLGGICFFIWLTKLNSKFENSRVTCQATSECILMKVGVCERVQAIHLSQVDMANAYTKRKKLVSPMIQCSPELPFEAYKPLCLNQKCQVVGQNSHLFLEVPSQPVAGQPFAVGMGFRINTDAEIEVEFQFSRDVRIVNGQATWSGTVEALKDYAIWVEMQAEAPGVIYLSGWVRIKEGDPIISPIHWGDYFTVATEPPLTTLAIRERVLATPTTLP